MKTYKIVSILLIILLLPTNVFARNTIDAKEPIDTSKKCNLKLNYKYNDKDLGEFNVEIYYIASVSSDFKYTPSEQFAKYNLELNGVQSNNEWEIIKDTIETYIDIDNITPTTMPNAECNSVEVNELNAGLYLIKTSLIPVEDYYVQFDSTLVNLPLLQEEGTWNYNVEINPKGEVYVIGNNKIKYKLFVQWLDYNPEERPEEVKVNIFRNGMLRKSIMASANNNWYYSWVTEDDYSEWDVLEVEIPTEYTVSYDVKTRQFIIINRNNNYVDPEEEFPEESEENIIEEKKTEEIRTPKTGDDIYIYLIILGCAIIGIALLIIGSIFNKRKDKVK